MGSPKLDRSFYESEYHFGADVLDAGESRLRRATDLLSPTRGLTFLDLGSGVGWAAHLVANDGARISLGVDFALRALELGQAHVPGVVRLQADGCRLPIRDNSVDRLLSFGSLEHFPDVNVALSEVARVLGEGAVAVLVVPNFYVRTEQPNELRLSFASWRELFSAAGLRVTAVCADQGPAIFRDRRPLRIAFRAAAKVLALVPRMQYQFIFKVEPS